MNKLSNRRQAATRVTNGSGVRIPDWQATVMRLNDETGDELSLGCKISLGQKHTSMRKGKQAKRRFLLQRQEARSAALFG